MFDSVPISVALCLQSASVPLQCGSEVFRAVYEKHGSFNIVVVPQLCEKYLGMSGSPSRNQPQMDNFPGL